MIRKHLLPPMHNSNTKSTEGETVPLGSSRKIMIDICPGPPKAAWLMMFAGTKMMCSTFLENGAKHILILQKDWLMR